MLENIHIQNYRGIKDLKIKDFKRINLFVGDNNSCKTSVLEAIFLLLCGTNCLNSLFTILYNMRNNDSGPAIDFFDDNLWKKIKYLFHDLQTNKNINISTKENKINLNIEYSEAFKSFVENARVSASPKNLILKYSGENETQEGGFSNINGNMKIAESPRDIVKGLSQFSFAKPKSARDIHKYFKTFCDQNIKNKDKIFDELKQIEPSLLDIRTDEDIACFIKEDVALPINFMGDGLRSFLHTITQIHSANNGIVLNDEIENGLHYETQSLMWKNIIKATKEANTQIFATTHSYEMIEALDKVYQKEGKNLIGEDEIRLFNLNKTKDKDNKIEDTGYNANMIKHIIENEREVR